MKLPIPYRYGLLAGAVTVIYFLGFYFIDKRLMLNAGVSWGSLGIYVIFMWQACRKGAQMNENFPFREALRTAFAVYVIASVIYYGFYYVLHGLVDPELSVIQRELMIETTRQMSDMLGAGNMEREIQQLENASLEVRPRALLLSLGWSLIGGFLISLIIAAITRR